MTYDPGPFDRRVVRGLLVADCSGSRLGRRHVWLSGL